MADAKTEERIAVVGGGIAGLFCAYILKTKGKKVDLFEATDRLGGRIRTIRLHKDNTPFKETEIKNLNVKRLEFHAEFGAMRFDCQKQKLLGALLNHLEINDKARAPHKQLEDFPAYGSPGSTHDPKYELGPFERDRDSYQLLQLAILRIITKIEVREHQDGKQKALKKSAFRRFQRRLAREVSLASAIGDDPLKKFIALAEKIDEETLWEIQRYGYISVHHFGGEEDDWVPLFTLGFWNLLSAHLSHEALNRVRDLGTFFHLIPENPNAAEWLTWWLRGFAISEKLKWIKGGMETITEELSKKLTDQEKHPSHRVLQLLSWQELSKEEQDTLHSAEKEGQSEGPASPAPEERPGIYLKAEIEKKTEIIGPFSRVILALPKSPLEKIVFRSAGIFKKPQTELETLLDSVYGFPLVKVFFVVKNRWWEEEARANKDATRVPTRELHYWKGKTPGSKQGLIMIYTDRPASAFWGNFVRSGPHEDVGWTGSEEVNQSLDKNSDKIILSYKQKERMKAKLVRYLNENQIQDFKEKDIEWVGIRDWSRDPVGGGNHAWRPKRRYWHVMHELAALDLKKGFGPCQVHVCGEAYSDYHGFIEGALRSVVYALSKVLKQDTDLTAATEEEPKQKAVDATLHYLKPIEDKIENTGEWDKHRRELYDWIVKLDGEGAKNGDVYCEWESNPEAPTDSQESDGKDNKEANA